MNRRMRFDPISKNLPWQKYNDHQNYIASHLTHPGPGGNKTDTQCSPPSKRDERLEGGSSCDVTKQPVSPTIPLIRFSFSARYVNGSCCESKQNQSVIVLLP
ncbi:unnamed protein product [Euphydryas editha]|uniref:Uncharacterized protein n=1 Tax=Euphydryas editha TaxID=104508 RepID=A0AAU9UYU2_EUPED|nr:unnamed protein product [Euphydryas editha]